MLTDFLRSLTDLARMPRALWIVIGVFVVESSAYIGVLTLMTTYLSADLGWDDPWAGIAVSVFTLLVTLCMLGFGGLAEGLGIRRAILLALALCTLGRLLYTVPAYAGSAGSWVQAILPTAAWLAGAVVVALLITAVGEAVLMPVPLLHRHAAAGANPVRPSVAHPPRLDPPGL